MKRLIILLVIFPLLLKTGYSQRMSVVEADKLTYDYYLKGQWQQLIKTANEALKQGIDFFYLRTRLGIAYYNRGQYRLAIKHFRKALQWYPKDKVILEYLYYSYLLGGQLADANKLIYDMPIDLRNKLLKKTDKNLQSWQVYYSALQVRNPDALRFTDIDGDYNIKGEQTISYGTNVPTFEASWRTFTGYNVLQLNFYAFDNLYRLQENGGTVEENPLYIREFPVNFIRVSSINHRLDLMWNIATLVGTSKKTAEVTISRGRWSQRATVLQTTPIFDFVASAGIKYKLPRMDFSAVASAQLYSFQPNLQLTLTPAFYPLGSTSLYLSPGLTVKQDLKQTQYLALISAGIGIKQRLWISAEYWKGQMGYFNTGMGTLIFNDEENILSKAAVNITYQFKKWAIYGSYNIYNKERFIRYQDNAGNILTRPYTYQADVFTIGLIFYPNVK